jgi:ABC-2 type transport system ATP-binding protein
VRVLGHDVRSEATAVRARIGVVFQAPALDRKLTVLENLFHQGHLHGLRGATLRERAGAMLRRVGLADRARELVEALSGGMRRRLELAKAVLHRPDVLLLDEASAGLDPIARRELAGLLRELASEDGVTIVLTTHLMEEAERCDRVGILAEGRFVALGAPDALRSEIGGDVILLTSTDPRSLAEAIRTRFDRPADEVPGGVRLEHEHGGTFVAELFEALRGKIDSVTLSRPTLEDVFFRKTGHAFRQDGAVG